MSKSKPKQPNMDDLVAGEDIPRFVISITDTQTVTGNQYFTVSIAADESKNGDWEYLGDFFRVVPKAKRTKYGRTELQAMMKYFEEKIKELDEKPYEPMTPIEELVNEIDDEDITTS